MGLQIDFDPAKRKRQHGRRSRFRAPGHMVARFRQRHLKIVDLNATQSQSN
jgi:hypothetical protein